VPRSGSDDDSPILLSIYDFERKIGGGSVEVKRSGPEAGE
jgi:hypothetical protein